jgi:long-chain fatty acid transport protein
VLDTVNITTPSGGTMPMKFGWEDQTVFAIGAQKELNAKTTVRFGYNYGASPIGPEDVTSNYGSLAVTEQHLSLGMTRKFGDKISTSLSYVRAFNNEVSNGVNSIELEQNVINFQVSYKN